MELKRIREGINCLDTVRWLVIAEMVALFVSTSLTSALEIILVATVLICADKFRGRAVILLRQPLARMVLLFVGILCLGLFYGLAPLREKLEVLKGWRKLILLPIVLLAFDDPRWKQRMITAVAGAAAIGALLSFAGLIGYGKPIVIHNHATQGIFFAVAAFAGVVAACHFEGEKEYFRPWPMMALAALFIANIILVTPGRGGYLVLLVLSMVAAFTLARGWKRVVFVLGAPLTIVALLIFSPVASERVQLGVEEIQGYQQAEEYSSMGIRMVMWQNTLRLVKERPVLGYGLGGLKEAYGRLVAGVPGWKGIAIDDPHNQFLKITAELGLVGLVAFLGLLLSFVWQEVSGFHRILGLGVLLAWTASSMFAGHFASWAEGRFILIWAGAMLATPFPSGKEMGKAGC